MSLLSWFINLLADGLILATLIYALLSFVVPPWHPWRRALGRVVEPLLAPIRQVLPPVGGLDFSPLVLIILINLVRQLLLRMLIW